MEIIFRSIKSLENQIDSFLDAVSEGALIFEEGIKKYVEEDWKTFEEIIAAINILENRADDMRRIVEGELYSHTLIPESRGDVLGLLETMDNVIDTSKKTLSTFNIEHPEIPIELRKDFIDLASKSTMATQELVMAARAFFKDVAAIKNYLHKVIFYEKEADRVEEKLNTEIFSSDLDLAQKMHLRYFTFLIARVSDQAEGVADRLRIYAIKRSV